jgi:tRNA pseudouridine38-40 synthase
VVATLVQVGQGKVSPAVFAAILDRADRRAAAATAPPQGLCLLRVWY